MLDIQWTEKLFFRVYYIILSNSYHLMYWLLKIFLNIIKCKSQPLKYCWYTYVSLCKVSYFSSTVSYFSDLKHLVKL